MRTLLTKFMGMNSAAVLLAGAARLTPGRALLTVLGAILGAAVTLGAVVLTILAVALPVILGALLAGLIINLSSVVQVLNPTDWIFAVFCLALIWMMLAVTRKTYKSLDGIRDDAERIALLAHGARDDDDDDDDDEEEND